MIYLAKETATGKLVSVWVPDSSSPTEYKDGQILGPMPKDANGDYENPEWIVLENNVPVVDQAAKTKIKKDKQDNDQKEVDRKKARGDLDKIDWTKVTTIDDVIKILKDVVKTIK